MRTTFQVFLENNVGLPKIGQYVGAAIGLEQDIRHLEREQIVDLLLDHIDDLPAPARAMFNVEGYRNAYIPPPRVVVQAIPRLPAAAAHRLKMFLRPADPNRPAGWPRLGQILGACVGVDVNINISRMNLDQVVEAIVANYNRMSVATRDIIEQEMRAQPPVPDRPIPPLANANPGAAARRAAFMANAQACQAARFGALEDEVVVLRAAVAVALTAAEIGGLQDDLVALRAQLVAVAAEDDRVAALRQQLLARNWAAQIDAATTAANQAAAGAGGWVGLEGG